MEWYIPISIIPGIGFIITSTSNILLHLNDEISALEKDERSDQICSMIIKDKLKQLKTLSVSIVFQYLGILFFLLSGVSGWLPHNVQIATYLLYGGVLLIIVSISLMIKYSFRATHIRQNHLKI